MDKGLLAIVGGITAFGMGSALGGVYGVAIAIISLMMAIALSDSDEKEKRAEWERKRQEYLDSEKR